MKMRIVWSGLAASVVALATATGNSGPVPTATTDNELVDFNPATSELSAYPTGQTAIATYLHKATTVHLAANLTAYTPPDPCTGLGEAWNLTVGYDTIHRTTSTFVFEGLLSLMSDFSCRATVTSSTGAPLPIVYITPVAK